MFTVGQEVEVNLKQWLQVPPSGEALWKRTQINHVFGNGNYDTGYGIFHESAIRSVEEVNSDAGNTEVQNR